MEPIYLSALKTRLTLIRLCVYALLCLPFALSFVFSLYLPQQLSEQEPGIQFAILFSAFILMALAALQLTERYASSLRFLILASLIRDLNSHAEPEQVLSAYAPMVRQHHRLEARMEISYTVEIEPPRLLWNRGSSEEHIFKELDSGLWKRLLNRSSEGEQAAPTQT